MEPKDKKEYELAFVVKSENAPAEIAALVKKSGGEITQEANPTRIRLAYEIKKEKEAVFGFMQFMLDAEAVKGISDALNLNREVLRFLLVTPPPMKPRREIMPEGQMPREPRAARPMEPKTAPLSNQDLEKKIEEILQ